MMKLVVDLSGQTLSVIEDGAEKRRYRVSTSRHGAGERSGSCRTPRGRHVVRAKIGAGSPSGAVFRGRRPTGEVISDALVATHPGRDWILSRILWLSGCEPGANRLGEVDSMSRYIYIHGTPYEDRLGQPASEGCVRMGNADVIELFDTVPAGTPVEIVEAAAAAGIEA